MRIKGKLSFIRLLVPVLLFAGVQVFARAAANDTMPAADSASLNKMARPHADVLVISDRAFLMKSIKGTMSQNFKSSGCAASNLSVAVARSGFGDRCPIIDCPAPPPGCSYGPPDMDQNGCAINCGQLVCGGDN